MSETFWGETVVQPRDLLLHQSLSPAFRTGADRLLRKFGLSSTEQERMTERLWRCARDSRPEQFEGELKIIVEDAFDMNLIRRLLDERAEKVSKQIADYVFEGSLLDLGCGDGMVSWLLRERVPETVLMDVVNYVDERVKFPFLLSSEGEALPTSDTFDQVLLINVLHHGDDPLFLLDRAWAHTRGRLTIIESVYGDEARMHEAEMPFGLSKRDQFLYTSFFDWFYNRVLHSEVPVPFNYAPPASWRAAFQHRGMRLVASADLGIDMDIVPIHHYLFVLDR